MSESLQISLIHAPRCHFSLLLTPVLFFSVSSSAQADGEEHRDPEVQETAADAQVHQMRQVLPARDLPEETPTIGVRRRTQTELPDLREEVHAQIQADAPPLNMQAKTGIGVLYWKKDYCPEDFYLSL